jgi:hypothetical protein
MTIFGSMVTRVLLFVKKDKSLDPAYIGLSGANAVVFGLNGRTKLIEEFWLVFGGGI